MLELHLDIQTTSIRITSLDLLPKLVRNITIEILGYIIITFNENELSFRNSYDE
jgi:hypothetical protein